jgi:hypothetical protein
MKTQATSTSDTTPAQTPAIAPPDDTSAASPSFGSSAARPKAKSAKAKVATPKPDKPVDSRLIKLLPKNDDTKYAAEGSKREARFKLYRDSMTVSDYLAAGGRLRDVARDQKAGRISVK